jgi:hypothetical protein
VEDLDRQVLTAVAEHLLDLLAKDPARPVMRIDDAIADLELDVRRWGNRLKIIQLLFR